MAKKRRFDFTKKNKRSGKVENVGYLDLEQDEEQSRCSLYFYGDIVSATWESMWYEEDRCPQDIADFLNQLDGYEDIDIYFNSGGGDVFAGLAIYNQLKRYDGHKVGYVDGMAASIASVIMFACDELHFATGAQAMIHKPLCMAYGNADDFKAVIKQLNLCEDSILDVYMEHVQEGVTRDKIQSLIVCDGEHQIIVLLKDGIRTRSGDRCIVKNQIGVQFQMVIATFELATHQRVRRRCTVRNWRKRFAPVILDSVVQIRWYYDKSDRVRNQRQQPHGRRRGG